MTYFKANVNTTYNTYKLLITLSNYLTLYISPWLGYRKADIAESLEGRMLVQGRVRMIDKKLFIFIVSYLS